MAATNSSKNVWAETHATMDSGRISTRALPTACSQWVFPTPPGPPVGVLEARAARRRGVEVRDRLGQGPQRGDVGLEARDHDVDVRDGILREERLEALRPVALPLPAHDGLADAAPPSLDLPRERLRDHVEERGEVVGGPRRALRFGPP